MSLCDCAQDKQKRNKGAADEPDVDCRERSALAERELILFCDIIRGIKNFLAPATNNSYSKRFCLCSFNGSDIKTI